MNNVVVNDLCKWYPEQIITSKANEGYVCFILNRKINIPIEVAQELWENANLRCTVDGGTNRWREFLENNCKTKTMKPPDFITGDFDSITEETLKYFDNSITKKVHTPNQNATDFTKAIGTLLPLMNEQKVKNVIVFHETSGRLDQIIANLNTLYKHEFSNLNIFLLSGNSMTWLLRTGKHEIIIPRNLLVNKRWCALMPLSRRANDVTTTGLKWNLTNHSMEFGGIISTSNTYAEENVQITTDCSLIWSMGLFAFDDD